MKNLTTTLPKSDTANLTYGDILAVALKNPGKDGITFDMLAKRQPAITKLESIPADGTIELTHDQWALVRSLFLEHRWPVINETIYSVGLALKAEMNKDLPVSV